LEIWFLFVLRRIPAGRMTTPERDNMEQVDLFSNSGPGFVNHAHDLFENISIN